MTRRELWCVSIALFAIDAVFYWRTHELDDPWLLWSRVCLSLCTGWVLHGAWTARGKQGAS
jgi:hypothetical protein